MSLKILVLISVILCTVNSLRFLEDTQTNDEKSDIVAQLKFPRERLIAMALAGDDYQRSKLPSYIIMLRGLREFIKDLSDDQIKSIIAEEIKDSNGELTLTKLKELANIPLSSGHKGYRKYLESLTKEKLIELALTGEKYSRKRNNQEDFDGGLHDYINVLEKKDIITIIENFIKQFPELREDNFLENLSSKSLLTNDELKAELNLKGEKDLAKIAILCERYHRTKHQEHLFGGLHDYVYTLSKKNIINAIMSFVVNNPELALKDKLNNMLSEELQRVHPIIGGLEDYAHLYAKAELMEMCYKAEEHDKKIRGIKGVGGLNDYLWRLSKDQVLDILLDYIKNYPELRKTGALETKAGLIEGGISKFLENKSVEDLKKYCLALEDYTRKKEHREDMDGGLHDYIERLDKMDLINYIIGASDKYNELIKPGKLDEIVAKNNHKIIN